MALLHAVADDLVLLFAHLNEIHRVLVHALGLPHAPDDSDEAKYDDEDFIRHVHGLLPFPATIPLLVPSLPVLPGRIHARVPGPLAPGPFGLAGKAFHAEFAGPTGAIEIVSAALRRIR